MLQEAIRKGSASPQRQARTSRSSLLGAADSRILVCDPFPDRLSLRTFSLGGAQPVASTVGREVAEDVVVAGVGVVVPDARVREADGAAGEVDAAAAALAVRAMMAATALAALGLVALDTRVGDGHGERVIAASDVEATAEAVAAGAPITAVG